MEYSISISALVLICIGFNLLRILCNHIFNEDILDKIDWVEKILGYGLFTIFFLVEIYSVDINLSLLLVSTPLIVYFSKYIVFVLIMIILFYRHK